MDTPIFKENSSPKRILKRAQSKRIKSLFLVVIFTLSACQPSLWGTALPPTAVMQPIAIPSQPADTAVPTLSVIPPTETFTPAAQAMPLIWASSAIPFLLLENFEKSGFQVSTSREGSDGVPLDVAHPAADSQNISTWTYALVAPFPTLVDNITRQDFLDAWHASSSGPFGKIPLLMEESTRVTFAAILGEPGEGAVKTVPAKDLLGAAWNQMPEWAIIPFENVEPKWKVLMIEGQSPIQKGFDPSKYPLIATYQLSCADPCSLSAEKQTSFENRDPRKLATVIMTGVTALVRATAATMDAKGILYPGEAVRGMLLEADVTHINNEVPFYSKCPSPDPNQKTLVFCSAPRYIKLLTDIGTDVMELSGDHFADYGTDAMLETIDIYKQNKIPYYGGGLNVEDGRKPLLLEVNGNKLMFIGCNYKKEYASATDTVPGSVPCDFDYMTAQIAQYRAQGYLPISTFQYNEFDFANATAQQEIDFRTMADAGAVIVSGSQAHVPQVMEFYKNAFIHYGLGNLFFDQVLKVGRSPKQNEFIDRHVFYDGRYLGVELMTTFLEDYARPRYMNPAERIKFLTDYFNDSGWDFLQAGPSLK
jgi:Bacterial capsule synthesis protein PGA_cap